MGIIRFPWLGHTDIRDNLWGQGVKSTLTKLDTEREKGVKSTLTKLNIEREKGGNIRLSNHIPCDEGQRRGKGGEGVKEE